MNIDSVGIDKIDYILIRGKNARTSITGYLEYSISFCILVAALTFDKMIQAHQKYVIYTLMVGVAAVKEMWRYGDKDDTKL